MGPTLGIAKTVQVLKARRVCGHLERNGFNTIFRPNNSVTPTTRLAWAPFPTAGQRLRAVVLFEPFGKALDDLRPELSGRRLGVLGQERSAVREA
jgi:hypothetical protein